MEAKFYNNIAQYNYDSVKYNILLHPILMIYFPTHYICAMIIDGI